MRDSTEKIIFIAIVVAIVILIGLFLYYSLDEELNAKGTITDKFILPNVRGFPKYYFVIDDKKDILVSEETYYEYDVGKYYPQ